MTAAISTEAIEFLRQLRPPPWILIAIKPDGPITAIPAHSAEDVEAFVSIHNGERNIYYSLNSPKMAMIASHGVRQAQEHILTRLRAHAPQSAPELTACNARALAEQGAGERGVVCASTHPLPAPVFDHPVSEGWVWLGRMSDY